MAYRLRKTIPQVVDIAAVVNGLATYTVNAVRTLKADIAGVAAVGTSTPAPGFHNDTWEKPVASANATDLPTSLALVNELAQVYTNHIKDTLSHVIADTNTLITTVAPVDLATAITMANDIKAKYNLHRAVSTTVHPGGADSTNTIATANATDLTTLMALLNASKTALNAHIASGPTVKSMRLVSA